MSAISKKDVLSLASACAGTGWKQVGQALDEEGFWTVRFKHARGDCGVVRFSREVLLRWAAEIVDEFVARPLPWPDHKPGDSPPTFTLSVPIGVDDILLGRVPAIDSFEPGMTLVVVAVDRADEIVTLVPQNGPWSAP